MEQHLYFRTITDQIPNGYISDNLFNDMITNHIDNQNIIDNSIKYIIIDRPELYKKLKIYNIPIVCIAYSESLRIQFGRYGADINFVIFYDEISYKTDTELWLTHISNQIESMGFFKDSIIIANPPYQGINKTQIYPKFYKWAIQSGAKKVCMIFPTNWQESKCGKNLNIINNKSIKEDTQIVYIDNVKDVFKNTSGVKYANIIYWQKDYDNGLNGKQYIYTNHKNPQIKKLQTNDVEKLPEIIETVNIIKSYKNFNSISSIISEVNPYNLCTDFFKDQKKYKLSPISNERINIDDILVYGKNNGVPEVKYINKDYILPKKAETNSHKNKYKIFFGKSWGNMSGKFIGGVYTDIIIGYPNEICIAKYIETGEFNTLDFAKYHAKYLLTKFVRFLLLDNKKTHDCLREKFKSVPIQNYTEDFWKSDDIDYIDECLFNKYNLPEHLKEFIRNNIQPRTINNIINYNESWDESHKPQVQVISKDQTDIDNDPKITEEQSLW